MKWLFPIVLLLSFSTASGQWDVPVPIDLNGDQPEKRQIEGLADPDAPDAAVSFDAARATSMAYATATGTSALQADLSPAPSAYTAGMTVTIVPTAANEAGATLDLNGSGAVPIVKWGAVPLDSADLQAGEPVRLIYDGSAFLLIGPALKACASGFSPVGSRYCISDSSFGTGSFYQAVAYCASIGARLCTYNEWIAACRQDTAFIGTLIDAEWVDHAANNADHAKRMGYGSIGSGDGDPDGDPSCQHGTTTPPTNETGRIRCCSNR